MSESVKMVLVPATLTREMHKAMLALTEKAPYIGVREKPSNPRGKQWEVTSSLDGVPEITVLHQVGSEAKADELKDFEEIALGWAGLIAVATGKYNKQGE